VWYYYIGLTWPCARMSNSWASTRALSNNVFGLQFAYAYLFFSFFFFWILLPIYYAIWKGKWQRVQKERTWKSTHIWYVINVQQHNTVIAEEGAVQKKTQRIKHEPPGRSHDRSSIRSEHPQSLIWLWKSSTCRNG